MKRIVFTIATGKPKFAHCALGLARSLRLLGDLTPRVVITDQPSFPWAKTFSQTLQPVDDPNWIFFSKLTALNRTDADQVLFIDSDGLAFKRVDDIFNYCEGKGLCVQGYPESSGDWYGKVEDHLSRHKIGAMPKFNGGLIYYERTAECQRFIAQILEMAGHAKELGFQRNDPLIPDEPVISLAMAQTSHGHLIPEEMDFTNSATGLIGKLTLDVLENDCHFVCRRNYIRMVRPYIFHASRYVNFLVYWKQLDRLENLEKYEGEHGFGYMAPGHKIERSIQRRILKLRGKL